MGVVNTLVITVLLSSTLQQMMVTSVKRNFKHSKIDSKKIGSNYAKGNRQHAPQTKTDNERGLNAGNKTQEVTETQKNPHKKDKLEDRDTYPTNQIPDRQEELNAQWIGRNETDDTKPDCSESGCKNEVHKSTSDEHTKGGNEDKETKEETILGTGHVDNREPKVKGKALSRQQGKGINEKENLKAKIILMEEVDNYKSSTQSIAHTTTIPVSTSSSVLHSTQSVSSHFTASSLSVEFQSPLLTWSEASHSTPTLTATPSSSEPSHSEPTMSTPHSFSSESLRTTSVGFSSLRTSAEFSSLHTSTKSSSFHSSLSPILSTELTIFSSSSRTIPSIGLFCFLCPDFITTVCEPTGNCGLSIALHDTAKGCSGKFVLIFSLLSFFKYRLVLYNFTLIHDVVCLNTTSISPEGLLTLAQFFVQLVESLISNNFPYLQGVSLLSLDDSNSSFTVLYSTYVYDQAFLTIIYAQLALLQRQVFVTSYCSAKYNSQGFFHDYDECASNARICPVSQICLNTYGTYLCVCGPNKVLTSDLCGCTHTSCSCPDDEICVSVNSEESCFVDPFLTINTSLRTIAIVVSSILVGVALALNLVLFFRVRRKRAVPGEGLHLED